YRIPRIRPVALESLDQAKTDRVRLEIGFVFERTIKRAARRWSVSLERLLVINNFGVVVENVIPAQRPAITEIIGRPDIRRQAKSPACFIKVDGAAAVIVVSIAEIVFEAAERRAGGRMDHPV